MTTLTVYRELKITGEESQVKAFIEEFDRSLPATWKKLEGPKGSDGIESHIYLKSDYGKAGLRIVLWRKPSYQIYVQNLIPQGERESLRKAEDWNRVIEELYAEVFEPVARRIDVEIELEQGDIQITKYLTPETAKKLETFSGASYGTSHPCDQERWYTFLFAAHEEAANEKLPEDFLRRWFEAQEKWSDEQIEEMLYEFSHVLFILGKYDRHRAGLGFWS